MRGSIYIFLYKFFAGKMTNAMSCKKKIDSRRSTYLLVAHTHTYTIITVATVHSGLKFQNERKFNQDYNQSVSVVVKFFLMAK